VSAVTSASCREGGARRTGIACSSSAQATAATVAATSAIAAPRFMPDR
jgi:hypothetical protein